MAFEEITTEMVEGAEDQEVTEPESTETDETGAEDQEVTEPESEEPEGKTAADAAFAEMRRKMEEAQKAERDAKAELESLKAQQAARQAALKNMDIDEIDAIAESVGISREEVLDNIEREEEAAEAEIEAREKDQTIAALQARIDEVEAERMMEQDLVAIQKLDPEVKSLDDLGSDFIAYISAGLTAEQAYFAIRGKDIATKSTPPDPPGKITDSAPPEKDYYTEDEVANMTSEEKEKNWEKIMASLPKWKK